MLAFPLDNSEYEADSLGAWCGMRTRGVFASDIHYAVSSNDDMTITVSPGLAWLKADDFWGVCAFEANPQTFTLDIADGSLPRIDTVCVRLNKNLNLGETVIKKGAYNVQPPVVTPPERSLDYDEIYVATVTVRAGAVSILPGDITDQRLNEDYCGLMRDGVTGIPTSVLDAQFREFLQRLKDELTGVEDGSEYLLKTIFDPNSVVAQAGGIEAFVEAINALNMLKSIYDNAGLVAAAGGIPAYVKGIPSKLKLLWSGSWSSGTITVPGISEYDAFMLVTSSIGELRGYRIGGTISSSGWVRIEGTASVGYSTYHRAATSGDTLTWAIGNYLYHTPSGAHGAAGALTITQIYGLGGGA